MVGARKRWLLVSLAVASVVAVVLTAGPSLAGRRHLRTQAAPDVVQADALRGDVVLAGPALLDDRFAVWAEAGPHRLLLRSLDTSGRTRTIFSTSRAAGVPKGTRWPFTVSSLVASHGRLAFVELVAPCASAPPRAQSVHCRPLPPRNGWNSATLLAGAPGAIRKVEGTQHLCARGFEPVAVAIASQGLVVDELHDPCAWRYNLRLALRSIRGRLRGVITSRAAGIPVAAGQWLAFGQQTGGRLELHITRLSSGHSTVRFRGPNMTQVAVDGQGRFAFLTPGRRGACQVRLALARLNMGQAGRRGVRVLTSRAEQNFDLPGSSAVAIAGPQVAFIRATGRCLEGRQVVVWSAGSEPSPVAGLNGARSVSFDGHLLAALHANTIELTATGCPRPSVAVPPNEPVYTAGPTKLVTGLYIQGGPVPPPPCKPEPRGPYAGRVTVKNSRTGAAVASQRVSDGHLARIPLPAGTYDVTGHFSGGYTPSAVRVRIRPGHRTRQDVFEDVP